MRQTSLAYNVGSRNRYKAVNLRQLALQGKNQHDDVLLSTCQVWLQQGGILMDEWEWDNETKTQPEGQVNRRSSNTGWITQLQHDIAKQIITKPIRISLSQHSSVLTQAWMTCSHSHYSGPGSSHPMLCSPAAVLTATGRLQAGNPWHRAGRAQAQAFWTT